MKTVIMLSICATLVFRCLASPHDASPAAAGSPSEKNNSIAGDWVIHFQAGKISVAGKLHLALEGGHLTGTIDTEHTGPGTVQNGKWSNDGKLTATLIFERHESIVFEGRLKPDGTLAGKYQTEGRTDIWQAEKGQTPD